MHQVVRTGPLVIMGPIAEAVLPEVFDASYDPEVLAITCDLKIQLPNKIWREMGVRRVFSTPIRVTISKGSLKANVFELSLAPGMLNASVSLPAPRAQLAITAATEEASHDVSSPATPDLTFDAASSSPALSSNASTTSFRFSPAPESPGSPATTVSLCLSPRVDLDCSEDSSCVATSSVAVSRSVSASPICAGLTNDEVSPQGPNSAAIEVGATPTIISNTLRMYDFDEISYISHGAFGMVHLVKHCDTRTECALKSILKEPDVERAVRKEQRILSTLR